jgi:hypothetical protein
MARRPSLSLAAQARASAKRDSLPIRFVADYDHVEPGKTTAYKKGMVLMPPPEHRAAALAKGKAVVDGE